jgi:hypothetical protein
MGVTVELSTDFGRWAIIVDCLLLFGNGDLCTIFYFYLEIRDDFKFSIALRK